MVNSLDINQQRFVRKLLLLSIASLLVANLLLVNFAFAKKLELNEKQVEKIKIGLDLVKTFGNIVLSEDKLKTVFNTVFSGGETSVDVTYGLLALSAFNEMELIDLVVSQRYRKEADKYFNSVLEERSNLFSYYKRVGLDVPKILSGKITGPIAALTLNSFSISNEIINIFLAFNTLVKEKQYDGLWRYFDERRNGTAPQDAWELARFQMGFAVKANFLSVEKLDKVNEQESELAIRFSQLWDKWGQHTTAFGVTAEAKLRFNEEMRGLVAQAIEANTVAERVYFPSSLGKIQSAIANLAESVKRLSMEAVGVVADKAYALTKDIISTIEEVIARGGAGFISIGKLNENQTKLSLVTDEVKLSLAKDEGGRTKPGLVEYEAKPVENLASLSLPQIQQKVAEAQPQLIPNKEEIKLSEAKDEQKLGETKLCELNASLSPQLDGVIFHEIGWMGTLQSGNDEWMKLKNISQSEALLEGWQLLDKDKQIAVVFGKNHTISSQGIFMLERTNDSSLPNTAADLVYAGALNNTEETVYLFDKDCKLRDKVAASPNWPAGENESKKPMERGNDLGWKTLGVSASLNGASLVSSSSSTASPSLGIPGGSPPPPPSPTYLPLLISEIQIAGQSATDEFIELYNPNSTAADLSRWFLTKKTLGGSDSGLVSALAFTGTIAPYGYFLIVPQLNSDGTTNYKGSAVPDLYYSGASYSLAADNTVFLYNPLGQEVDRVGLGQSVYGEGSAGSNPPANQSLARKAQNGVYQDTGNNAQDFQVQAGTPKAVNPNPQDTTPPQVTLTSVASSQSDVAFSLSWTTTDPQGNGTPSGVQSIFVEYTVTPSATGVFAKYNNSGVWTNWQAGSTGKITLGAQTTSLSIRAQDGVSYTFQVSASDVAGNISTVASAATAVTLSKTVVVNEIAWIGTTASANDEWVELYNTTNSPVSLASWTLTADDGTPSIQLAGTIGALSYFLLERTADTTVSNVSSDQLYTGALANEGEYLRLSNASGTLVDAVDALAGWFSGDNTTKQSMERVSATQGGSKSSNWAKNNVITHNGKDAGIAIVYGTPGNWINGTPKQANSTITSPTTIDDTDLRFDEFSTITLTLLGSPYTTTNGIASIIVPAGKTLIVEPGVTVKFKDNAGYLTVQGTLKAQGTQENQITFTVDAGAVWCGIRIVSPSTDSQLDYVIIDKAKSLVGGGCNQSFITYSMYVESSTVTMNNSVIQLGAEYRKLYLKNSNSTINASTVSGAALNADSVGIYIDGGSPTISNSTISNNSIGIFVNSLSNTPTIQNNTFTGNTYAVKLDSASVVLSGNTAANNTYNGIFADGGTQANVTWQKDAIPYIVNTFTVSAGTTLTIQAGVVVKFIEIGFTNPEFTVNGTLITQGTAANPVVFTAVSDNTVGGTGTFSGVGVTSWKRIYIAPGSTGSQLTYTTLKSGGNTYYQAALYVKQSSVQLSNLTISNSSQSAIYSSLGTISGSGVTLVNNTYGFHIELGDCPALSGTNVTANVGPTIHPSSFPSPPCSF